ncbi:hypothetical protein [Mesorhizobium erdmanii]|uniref:J domain-containing protein n=1 Tax=Mesorhizobium erdmanii TaxID=1777866 RepID=A0A6M7UGF8_9HYPH|nr:MULTISPECIES: hypothetical protein [Mesorhizobium]OBQ70433.1 hypothetical protein A8146_27955 [Mesorhizobium loti]QKC76281.1 hypothetical protein EB233_12650 [Mesorhizobium erdmanii]
MFIDAFSMLGISDREDVTEREIKRAYATKLKLININEDRDSFIALRQAFEQARDQVNRREYFKEITSPDETQIADDTDAPALKNVPLSNERPIPATLEAQALRAMEDDIETLLIENIEPPAPKEAAPNRTVSIAIEAPALRAMKAVETLITEPLKWQRIDSWLAILDGELLQTIDDIQAFETRMRTYVCEQSGFGEQQRPLAKPWMMPRLLGLLDERFGWTRNRGSNYWERQQLDWLHALIDPETAPQYRMASTPQQDPEPETIAPSSQTTGSARQSPMSGWLWFVIFFVLVKLAAALSVSNKPVKTFPQPIATQQVPAGILHDLCRNLSFDECSKKMIGMPKP